MNKQNSLPKATKNVQAYCYISRQEHYLFQRNPDKELDFQIPRNNVNASALVGSPCVDYPKLTSTTLEKIMLTRMEIFTWFSIYNIQRVLQFWAPFFSKLRPKKKVLDHVKNDQGNAVNHFHLVLKDSRMYVKVSIISDIG